MPDIGDNDVASRRVHDLEAGDLGGLACIDGENDRGMSCAGVQPHVRGHLGAIVPARRIKALQVSHAASYSARQHFLTRIQAVQASTELIGAEYGITLK